MKRWLNNLIFPLFLSLLLGGASFWLNRATDIEIQKVHLDPNKPQYLINNILVKDYDIHGKLKDSFRAKLAWQLPEQTNTFFENLFLEMYEDNILTYRASSDLAVYNSDTKIVELNNNVIIDKLNSKLDIIGKLSTKAANIDTIKRSIQTNNNTDNLQLEQNNSRVKAIIYDPQAIK